MLMEISVKLATQVFNSVQIVSHKLNAQLVPMVNIFYNFYEN